MKDVLISSYFCTHVYCLLSFDIDNIVAFDIKYFFQDLSAIILTWQRLNKIWMKLTFVYPNSED